MFHFLSLTLSNSYPNLIHICIHASLCLVWKKQTMNVQSYWTPQKGKVNNKQNDLKQEFLFLKDPPLNLRESGSKYFPLIK